MIEVELVRGGTILINPERLDFAEWSDDGLVLYFGDGEWSWEIRGSKERLRKLFIPDALSELAKVPGKHAPAGIEKGGSVV